MFIPCKDGYVNLAHVMKLKRVGQQYIALGVDGAVIAGGMADPKDIIMRLLPVQPNQWEIVYFYAEDELDEYKFVNLPVLCFGQMFDGEILPLEPDGAPPGDESEWAALHIASGLIWVAGVFCGLPFDTWKSDLVEAHRAKRERFKQIDQMP